MKNPAATASPRIPRLVRVFLGLLVQFLKFFRNAILGWKVAVLVRRKEQQNSSGAGHRVATPI